MFKIKRKERCSFCNRKIADKTEHHIEAGKHTFRICSTCVDVFDAMIADNLGEKE